MEIEHICSYESMSTGLVHCYLVTGEYDGMTICQGIESSHAPMFLTMGDELVEPVAHNEIIEIAVNRQRARYEELNRPVLMLIMYNDKRGILEQLGIDENPPIYRSQQT